MSPRRHSERRSHLRVLLLLATCLSSVPAAAQTFIAEGAAPGNAPNVTDPGAFSSFTGSTSTVILDPLNPATMIVGSVNGGIWRSTNAAAGGESTVNWTVTTDDRLSLSIASLGYDPANAAHMVAGVGRLSNGSNVGGPALGVMTSGDGGTSWSTLESTPGLGSYGATAVALRGTTVLAGSSDLGSGYDSGGLVRSVGGGAFTAVTLPGQDTNAPVLGISRASGGGGQDVLVAAGGGATSNAIQLYRGPADGSSWTPLIANGSALATELATKSAYVANDPTQRYDTFVRIATAPDGSIAVATAKLFLDGEGTKSRLQSVYLSNDNGATWNKLSVNGASINTGGQALTNLSIAIDPNNTKSVYVAGDSSATAENAVKNYYLPIVKLTLNADNTTGTTDLSILGNSFLHPDARSLAFDANGRLVVLTDGGIYALSSTGTWRGLNGNLQLGEYYQVGYDSRSKRIAMAAQDNGVQLQNSRGGSAASLILSGDGINVSFADKPGAGDNTTIYMSAQNLALSRGSIAPNGVPIDSTAVQIRLKDSVTNEVINPPGEDRPGQAPFSSPFVLNRVDPTQQKFAIGTGSAYVGVDPRNQTADRDGFVDIAVTKVGTANGDINAIAYGVADAPDALLAGGNSKIYLAPDGTSATWAEKTAYGLAGGGSPTSVLFDARTVARFYAADGAKLWGTADTGATFTDLTPNLPTNFVQPRALEFVSQNGVNALVVGGINDAENVGNQIAVASSKSDGTLYNSNTFATTGTFFSRLGAGLPNAAIYSLYYSTADDLLVAGTFGRGAFVLYDMTSYFQQAQALWFGKGDNDSTPVASQLTNGVDENGTSFDRGLTKFGSGTLTIAAPLTASYAGVTTVNAGTMIVNGSITSSSNVAVLGGTLSGTGTVPTTVVSSGARVAPGNPSTPTGTLNVQGNLTTNPGATYGAGILGTASSKASVSGAASLSGTLQLTGLGGTYALRQAYTLATATGGLTQSFSNITSTVGSTSARIATDANNLYVYLDPALAAAMSGSNQKAVGAALDNYVTQGGTLPPQFLALYSLSGSAANDALTQLANPGGTGVMQTSTQLNNSFLSLMLNPFGGAGTGPSDTPGAARAIGFNDAETGTSKVRSKATEAFAAVLPSARRPAQAERRYSIWGSGYGGYASTDGSSSAGTPDTTSRVYGFATGLDYRFASDLTAGFALGGAGTSWAYGSNLGGGNSDVFQAGFYASKRFGAAYVSAALAYAWQDTTTNRTVTIAGTDQLRGHFMANSFGGRLEGGYRIQQNWADVTPYAAVQVQNTSLPGYSESVVSGSSQFALSYNSMSSTAVRFELGSWIDKLYAMQGGDVLALRGRLAWAHDENGTQGITAAFQTLPGPTFVLNGAAPPKDLALLSSSVQYRFASGLSIGAKFDSELASRSRSFAGTGTVGYTW